MKNRTSLLIYPVVSCLLLTLAWTNFPFSFLFFFVSLIPLLIFEQIRAEQKISNRLFYLATYLAIFFANLISSFWMFKLGIINMIIIAAIYSLCFLPAFYFYSLAKKINEFLGYFIFILGWFFIEYSHTAIDWGFPIQTLGYGLANDTRWIQWYEITGVFGGTLWILTLNALLFAVWLRYQQQKKAARKSVLVFLFIFFIPVLFSWFIFLRDQPIPETREIKVMTLHSNLDCYSEKYEMPVDSMLEYYFQIIQENYDSSVDLVVLPENAISNLDWVEGFQNGQNKIISTVQDFIEERQLKNMLVGGISYEVLSGKPENNPLATFFDKMQAYVFMYNTAVYLEKNKVDFRTKEKLVPFEETHPFPKYKNWTRFLYSPLGGFTFSVRKDNKETLLVNNSFKLGPMICYESLYGDMARRMVRDGAQVLAVMLNEGWYDSLKGSQKFLNFSKVRAIETRRYVIRSSNRGISSVVDHNGEEIATKRRTDDGVIVQTIPLSKEITIYARFGYFLIHGLFLMYFPLIAFIWIKKRLVKNS